MSRDTLIMAALAIALLAIAFVRGGGLWLSGLQAGARSFWGLLPILLISFAIAGLMQVLVPREVLMRWLGAEAFSLAASLAHCSRAHPMPSIQWSSRCIKEERVSAPWWG
jgi:hypothetical protein